MLEMLHIRNLALIEDMTLEFGPGINVLTGETGAGKSFILKALGFVLGDKLSADIIRPGAEKAQVEAIFTLNGEEFVLRRELLANGRSRFFINDNVSSQESLKELRPKLLTHASQHGQQQFLQASFQAKILESGLAKSELLQKRDALLEKLKDVAAKIAAIRVKQGSLSEKRELLEIQKTEIDKVKPKQGEEEELESARAELRAQKNASQNYGKAMALLHGDDGPGLLDLLLEFERLLKQLAHENTQLEADYANVEALRQSLNELSAKIRRPPAKKFSGNMDEIEERLFELSQLKRKLKRTIPQILALEEEIRETLSFLDVCGLDITRLEREQKKLEGELSETIGQLRPLREKAAEKFASGLERHLKDLGFSEHARVLPEFASYEAWPGIKDERGRICWAPNPGQNPQPLDKIASGGELSRFLLAMTILEPPESDITYIFDEVDSGVGGKTLLKLGDKLEELASKYQLILITHWPQLAALGSQHFLISKSVRNKQTFTSCALLTGKERTQELSRMAGGGRQGDLLAQELAAEKN